MESKLTPVRCGTREQVEMALGKRLSPKPRGRKAKQGQAEAMD